METEAVQLTGNTRAADAQSWWQWTDAKNLKFFSIVLVSASRTASCMRSSRDELGQPDRGDNGSVTVISA